MASVIRETQTNTIIIGCYNIVVLTIWRKICSLGFKRLYIRGKYVKTMLF